MAQSRQHLGVPSLRMGKQYPPAPTFTRIHLQLREEDIITALTSASTRDILLVANQVHQLLLSQISRGS